MEGKQRSVKRKGKRNKGEGVRREEKEAKRVGEREEEIGGWRNGVGGGEENLEREGKKIKGRKQE